MEIPLDRKHRLKTIDNCNWTLQSKHKNKETKKIYWENLSYFGSLEHALKSSLTSPRFALGFSKKKELNDWMKKIQLISETIQINLSNNA